MEKKELSIEEIRIKDQARDSTIITLGILIIFGVIISALFVGDFFFGKTYITEALIHTIVAFPAGWIGHAVTSFFVEKAKTKMAELQNGNQGEQQK